MATLLEIKRVLREFQAIEQQLEDTYRVLEAYPMHDVVDTIQSAQVAAEALIGGVGLENVMPQLSEATYADLELASGLDLVSDLPEVTARGLLEPTIFDGLISKELSLAETAFTGLAALADNILQIPDSIFPSLSELATGVSESLGTISDWMDPVALSMPELQSTFSEFRVSLVDTLDCFKLDDELWNSIGPSEDTIRLINEAINPIAGGAIDWSTFSTLSEQIELSLAGTAALSDRWAPIDSSLLEYTLRPFVPSDYAESPPFEWTEERENEGQLSKFGALSVPWRAPDLISLLYLAGAVGNGMGAGLLVVTMILKPKLIPILAPGAFVLYQVANDYYRDLIDWQLKMSDSERVLQ